MKAANATNTCKRILTSGLALILMMQATPFASLHAEAAESASSSSTAVSSAFSVDPAVSEDTVYAESPASGEASEITKDANFPVSPSASEAELPAAQTGIVHVTCAEQLLNGIPSESTYLLSQDISMAADQMIPFIDGTLDGQGHTITLLDRTLANTVTGTIQNLIVTSDKPITGVDVNWSTNSGSFAVFLNGGKLYNCLSTACVSGPMGGYCGGMAYQVSNGAEIRNSIFAGTFVGSAKAGLVYSGWLEGTPATISNSFYNTDGGKVKKAIHSGFAGSDYMVEGTVSGLSLEEMQNNTLISALNQQNLGTGYLWQAVPGGLPILVPGGDSIEHADLEQLHAAIQNAERKSQSDYTPESWAVMQDALEKAKTAAGTIGISQSDVDAAAAALMQALEDLQEKERSFFPVKPPAEGVIHLSSADDFLHMDSTNPGNFFLLTEDITLEGGFFNRDLAGILDGGGHTVTLKTTAGAGSPLFNQILPTGVVQNLHVKVQGSFPDRSNFAPFASELKGGMIVNCISDVTGQHSAGFVLKMNGGIMSNCLTLGHNRRGALVHYQKSTDHQNTNGYTGGTFHHCYWAASNPYENIAAAAPDHLIDSKPVGDEELRSAAFLQQQNNQKGEFGVLWTRDAYGYPHLGTDQGQASLMEPRYPVEFVWHNGDVVLLENASLSLSPQLTDQDRFAGSFRLKNVPADSTISWSCEDRAEREVIALYDQSSLYVYHDGGALVQAIEHKADGTQELAAQIRVVSESRKIEQLRLVMDDQVVGSEILVHGSESKTLDIQAQYEGSTEFRTLPSYLAKLVPEDHGHIFTSYNSSSFHCEYPGTSRLTVIAKNADASVSTNVTSLYVPVEQIRPGISGTVAIHSRNSMGSGQFNDIPTGIIAHPENASYIGNSTLESSDPNIAIYTGGGAVIPFQAGDVTFTSKLNDGQNTVQGSSAVSFVYANPLVSVTCASPQLRAQIGEKQSLKLTFTGTDPRYAGVSETGMIWSYSQAGIVSITRPNPLMQIRIPGKEDSGDWVSSTEYELNPLKPGTVTVTGTPVDRSADAQPISFTVTVTGSESDIPVFDIRRFIAEGKQAAAKHLAAQSNDSFGQEWNLYALLRDGHPLEQSKLESYYASAAAAVKKWKPNVLATEIERTMIALSILDRDITNVEGVDLADMLCNHPSLTAQGSNALSWGLIALDLNNTPIPEHARWNRERMVRELLTYQNPNGGFGLDKNSESVADITAMALQALAFYQEMDGVPQAISHGLEFLAKTAEGNPDYGNAETISQVILTLAVLGKDLTAEPGFGNQADNLMSALSQYMVEHDGFSHAKGTGVSTMATVQVMQALCAYERFLNGQSSYWDLTGSRPSFDPVAHVIDMIHRLPDTITLKDIPAVRSARRAFDSLRPEQQKKVSNSSKLLQAEQAADVLSSQNRQIMEVVDQIAALPDMPTRKDAGLIHAARSAYNKLSSSQQQKVFNTAKLLAAEQMLADLEAAQTVIDAIAQFPSPLTLQDKSTVEEARRAYDALTAAQKELVVNRHMLDLAEKTLRALRKPGGKPGGQPSRKPAVSLIAHSNIIDAAVTDGIVSAQQLSDIQGSDLVLRITAQLETGEDYTLSIHGKDVSQAADFNMKMLRAGLYETEINQLANSPEIFRFEQEGAFPCPMLVELSSSLADGKYLLLRYDPARRQAVLVDSAQVVAGRVSFIIAEGGEYFLASKASAKPLPEVEGNTPSDISFPLQKEPLEPDAAQAACAEPPAYGVLFLLILITAAAVGVCLFLLSIHKQRKEHSGE